MADKKPADIDAMSSEKVDVVVQTTSDQISPAQIQDRFDTLRDLDETQMAALNRKLLRKIDWRLMPTITIMFLMNYLDRINVSNARLAGLQSDLGMSDTVWSTGISVSLKPQLFDLTSSWYTKTESPLRMAIWHAGNTISNIISGFLAAAILHQLGDAAGLYGWQWFFLIEGAVSILVAIAAFFLLPDWPENTRWLSQEESEIAQYRVLVSSGGKDEKLGGTWDGLKDAVRDPFTWMFCGMHFSLINAQSFKDFFPSIIKTFGFSELNTYLVQAPPYAISFATACLLAWSSGKYRESCYHIIGPIVVSAIGTAALISTSNVGARYFGAVLLIAGTYNGLNLQLSWETSLVPAPRSKKAALIAIANCVGQASHWYSPYFFPRTHEPFYRMGGGLILFGCLCTALLCWLVKWRAKRLNRKLDEVEEYDERNGVERGWRYIY